MHSVWIICMGRFETTKEKEEAVEKPEEEVKAKKFTKKQLAKRRLKAANLIRSMEKRQQEKHTIL